MAKSLLVHRFDTEEFGPQKELLQIVTYGNEEPEFGIDTLLIQGMESVDAMIEVTKTTTTSLFELEISALHLNWRLKLPAQLWKSSISTCEITMLEKPRS